MLKRSFKKYLKVSLKLLLVLAVFFTGFITSGFTSEGITTYTFADTISAYNQVVG